MKKHSVTRLMLLLVLGVAGSLSAMMVELSPAELRAQADVIVTGNVTDITSRWDDSHSMIFTDVTVSVERFDKGNAARRLIVRVPGGEVGDIGMAVEDMPTFAPGQKVSLHLGRTTDRAVFRLAGGGQGAALRGKPPREVYYSYSGYHRSPAACQYRTHSSFEQNWVSAIQAGAEAWNGAGSSFDLQDGGSAGNNAPAYDGVNIVTRKDLGNGGTLAVNYYWYNRKTKIVYENDIIFNTYYPWATNGAPGYYDVQNIGTHEMGHDLVLNDLYKSYQTEMTMYGYGAPGETKKRSLESGDIAGINYIYP